MCKTYHFCGRAPSSGHVYPYIVLYIVSYLTQFYTGEEKILLQPNDSCNCFVFVIRTTPQTVFMHDDMLTGSFTDRYFNRCLVLYLLDVLSLYLCVVPIFLQKLGYIYHTVLNCIFYIA